MYICASRELFSFMHVLSCTLFRNLLILMYIQYTTMSKSHYKRLIIKPQALDKTSCYKCNGTRMEVGRAEVGSFSGPSKE